MKECSRISIKNWRFRKWNKQLSVNHVDKWHKPCSITVWAGNQSRWDTEILEEQILPIISLHFNAQINPKTHLTSCHLACVCHKSPSFISHCKAPEGTEAKAKYASFILSMAVSVKEKKKETDYFYCIKQKIKPIFLLLVIYCAVSINLCASVK